MFQPIHQSRALFTIIAATDGDVKGQQASQIVQLLQSGAVYLTGKFYLTDMSATVNGQCKTYCKGDKVTAIIANVTLLGPQVEYYSQSHVGDWSLSSGCSSLLFFAGQLNWSLAFYTRR